MQSLPHDEDGVSCRLPTKIILSKEQNENNERLQNCRKTSKEENAHLRRAKSQLQARQCQCQEQDENYERLQRNCRRLLDKVNEENAHLRRKNAHHQARELMNQPPDVILANLKRTEEMFAKAYDALHEELQQAESELYELKIRCVTPDADQQLLRELKHKEEQVRLLKEKKRIMTRIISVLEQTFETLQTDSPTTDTSSEEKFVNMSLRELIEEQAKLQVEYELSNERLQNLEQASNDFVSTGTMENRLEDNGKPVAHFQGPVQPSSDAASTGMA